MNNAAAALGEKSTIAGTGELGVNEEDFAIDSGTGSISLEDKTRVEGNLTIGGKTGNVVFDIYGNGTHIIFESFQSQPIIFLTFTPNRTPVQCYVNNSLGWTCEMR